MDARRAEISNRFIIVIGIAAVLAVLAVPAWFAIYPRLSKMFSEEEKLKTVFEDNFDGVKLGSEWTTWGDIAFSNHPAFPGNSSLFLKGRGGGFMSGGVNRLLEAKPPLVIECDVYNCAGAFDPRAHQLRGGLFLFETGRGPWGIGLFDFHADNFLHIAADEKTAFVWKPDKRYRVRVNFETTGNNYTVEVRIEGAVYKSKPNPLPQWAKDWKAVNLGIHSGHGTAVFDNLRVSKPAKP